MFFDLDTWGDWDNEEYTGSLADTKVFTPSVSQNQSSKFLKSSLNSILHFFSNILFTVFFITVNSELSAPPGLEQQVLNPPSHPDDLVQHYNTTVTLFSQLTV